MLSLFAAFFKQKKEQQYHLTDLPDEVILKIFSHLCIKDLGNWTEVSKRFRNICWDKALLYGKMKKKYEKMKRSRSPELQLLYDIRNPKISLRQKNERFINTLIGNPDVMARLRNQKAFIPLLIKIFQTNPDLKLVFLKDQHQRYQQHQHQHQHQHQQHQKQTVQRTDESVQTHFPNQPNRSQHNRGFFLRFLYQLARFNCINCF